MDKIEDILSFEKYDIGAFIEIKEFFDSIKDNEELLEEMNPVEYWHFVYALYAWDFYCPTIHGMISDKNENGEPKNIYDTIISNATMLVSKRLSKDTGMNDDYILTKKIGAALFFWFLNYYMDRPESEWTSVGPDGLVIAFRQEGSEKLVGFDCLHMAHRIVSEGLVEDKGIGMIYFTPAVVESVINEETGDPMLIEEDEENEE